MDGQERLSNTESWEEECEDAAERELNALEEKLAAEREENSQRIWLSFQNAANAVAQLFRERGENLNGSTLWTPFQETANLVTILYKEGIDTNKRHFDAGYQLGHKKRNREVIAWAKKKKRSIRRDELLSYLSGKSPPRYQRADSIDGKSSEDMQCPNSLLQPVISNVGFTGWSKRRGSRMDGFDDELDDREILRESRKRSLSNQDVVMEATMHKKCKFF